MYDAPRRGGVRRDEIVSRNLTAAMDELAADINRTWGERIVDGVARRLRAAWRRWRVGDIAPAAERAFAWLAEWALAKGAEADAAEASAVIGVLAEFGERELAESLLRSLREEDSGGVWSLAHRVRAHGACGPEGHATSQRELVAALASRVADSLDTDDWGVAATGGCDVCRAAAIELFAAATLAQAARAADDSAGSALAARVVRRVLDRGDPGEHGAACAAGGQGLAALWDLGYHDLAAGWLARAFARQTRGGAIPAHPDGDGIDPAGVAKLAQLGFQCGQVEPAERAMRWLEQRQLANGAWPAAVGRAAVGRATAARRGSAWGAINYLRAARARVAAAFAGRSDVVPESIDAADGRLRAVAEWVATFPPGARIADVGCGNGRFLRRLVAGRPLLNFVGIDPSPALLAELPAPVVGIAGALPRLPLADGALDGVFAVESLEHALVPRPAVRELLRVLRPGGRLLIIDKRRDFQPLSRCEPWERWFLPEEFRAWLAEAADGVTIQPVAHGRHDTPTGLFMCVTARRRAAGMSRVA